MAAALVDAFTAPDMATQAITAVDRSHDTGWISYWTHHRSRARGVATAGLRAVTSWALTELDRYRLELGHRVNNPASCAVARHAGSAAEGLERRNLRYGAQRFDVELHSGLADDP